MNLQKASLKNFSSMRIGGEGNLVMVKNEEELVEAVEYAQAEGLRVHVLGEGTNSVFGDDLKDYLFLKIELKGIESKLLAVSCQLSANAGENWDEVVKFAIKENLWGIENLSYIPGTVGAAPVQNIGAYGTELKDTLISVRVYDIKEKVFKELSNEECHFSYRDSIFKQNPSRYTICGIKLNLSKTPKPILTYKPLDALSVSSTLQEIRDLVVKTRTTKLPDYNIYPNTGSFFKNTTLTKEEGVNLRNKFPDIVLHEVDGGYKVPSAWLIEHVAKMKGVRVGDIGTWPIQPLVLVNYGNGTFFILCYYMIMVRH